MRVALVIGLVVLCASCDPELDLNVNVRLVCPESALSDEDAGIDVESVLDDGGSWFEQHCSK